MALPRSSLSPASYRVSDVWRPGDSDTLIRYRCVEILPHGGFRVVARDAFALPVRQPDLSAAEVAFANALAKWLESAPPGGYPSIPEAIQQYED